MKNIFLTGFMGCGKTCVGEALAALTGTRFVDLDRMIVETAGMSVKEIFARQGEAAFRRLVSEVLAKVAGDEGIVVSTGGGAVLAEENRMAMRRRGTIVNLTATVAELVARLSGDCDRPLLKEDPSGERIAAMLTTREAYYADADLRIDTTGKPVQAIAAEILQFMQSVPVCTGPCRCPSASEVKVQTIRVELAERSYDIAIAAGNLDTLGAVCRGVGLSGTAALVTNATVAPLYAERVVASLSGAGYRAITIVLPDGESFKESSTLNLIYDALVDAALDRGSFIVALGGGVIGDMAGFAAASYLRGIPFVQVPTTLLSQVDSSVGGKTGINHPKGKNLIGAFYQPKGVLIDVSLLATLPDREYLSGLGEVVKYGAVLDADFFSFLEENTDRLLARDHDSLIHAVARSCALKARVVESDEREAGIRAVLNYGHTLGHAVETLTRYQSFLHGEAVAIGMVQAARISRSFGLCSQGDCERIESLLERLHLPLQLPEFSFEQYAEALSHDKKVREKGLLFVCNKGIGAYSLERVADPGQLLKICGIGA